MARAADPTYDFVVVGSGFGGSVSAMRLVEKGYSVLVLERGKRFRDQDFPRTNWNIWRFLWLPALRCFGIMQFSPLKDVLVLHGSGVGGGSLVYANVLMKPEDKYFLTPAWSHLADWKSILEPHYATARAMLGATRNPKLFIADEVLKEIAGELGCADTFAPTEVGVFFGDAKADLADRKGSIPRGAEGDEYPDPYFGGKGPPRSACIFCGGCMVGCRYNAKNSLVKNYLYFAEKWGARIQPESEVFDLRQLPEGQLDGARYEVVYRRTTGLIFRPLLTVRARNVVLSAGALGTTRLLLRCRDVTRSLPRISPCVGNLVRTNSETLLGVTNRSLETDFSKGLAITSVIHADEVTAIEPVRYPDGSSLIRLLAGPLIRSGGTISRRILRSIAEIARHPVDFLKTYILPGWAHRTTILLVMQTKDNRIRLRLGRSLFTLFRLNLVSASDEEHPIPRTIETGHQVARSFARRTNGIPLSSINESLFNIPTTAHILGGCPFGRDDQEGVIGLDCQVHNYPGLYVVDGSIVPDNPGINPSLTITALAEYAMSCIPARPGHPENRPSSASVALHDQQAGSRARQSFKQPGQPADAAEIARHFILPDGVKPELLIKRSQLGPAHQI
jgi:cholesterol oxidase